jgi:hypothetical protein
MHTHIINIIYYHMLSMFSLVRCSAIKNGWSLVPTQKIREVKGYEFLQALPVDGVLGA